MVLSSVIGSLIILSYSGVEFPSRSTAMIFPPQIAFVSAFCCKLLLGVPHSILIYDTDSFCRAFNLLCDCILLIILTYCAIVLYQDALQLMPHQPVF